MIEFVLNDPNAGRDATKVLILSSKDDLSLRIGNFFKPQKAKIVLSAIKNREYSPEKGKKLVLDDGAEKIILFGVADKLSDLDIQLVGAEISKLIKKDAKVLVDVPQSLLVKCASLALGVELSLYSFDKYFTTKKNDDFCQLETVYFSSTLGEVKNVGFEKMRALANGVRYGRDLCNEPSNKLTPAEFCADVKRLEYLGLEVEIIPSEKLCEQGFPLLYAVGQASINSPCAVIVKWKGDKAKKDFDFALVGKGITYDAGGINLKSASNLLGMHRDMSGAAVAVSVLKVLAMTKTKVNAAAVLVLAENMPSGNAYKPQDVLLSGKGISVEIINTDAEGRLALADGLWFASDKLKAKTVIDIATLTGAVAVALGEEFAGLFSNDDALVSKLLKAGENSGENLWRLPLCAAFEKTLKSDVADVKHIGGKFAGSSTAAAFLQKFVKDKVKWAHLDIAGVDGRDSGRPLEPKGATAFGIRLLCEFIWSLK